MLAINGGTPYIDSKFKPYTTLGHQELDVVSEVISSGNLSGFLGAPGSKFLGGPRVLEFEAAAASKFGAKYCVSFNSWTSGLIASVGSIPGLEPGDQIITSSWTMSATAMSILHWNAIPVFADIDPISYCLDPVEVERLITDRTKAILTVDIFGRSSNYRALRDICDRHNLLLIADSAQAPGALFDGVAINNLADIGGYSLNYHKHIQSGEGGFALTNDFDLASRMQLIRNHAESANSSESIADLSNMIGYNFRLGEIEAAIATEQLKKLDSAVNSRIEAANRLIEGLQDLPLLQLPTQTLDRSNVFYFLPMRFNPTSNISRDYIFSALIAEGVQGLQKSYVNVHRLPIFTKKIGYGSCGEPWKSFSSTYPNTYGDGKCPVAERSYNLEFLGIHMCSFEFDEHETHAIVGAFKKVWSETFG